MTQQTILQQIQALRTKLISKQAQLQTVVTDATSEYIKENPNTTDPLWSKGLSNAKMNAVYMINDITQDISSLVKDINELESLLT